MNDLTKEILLLKAEAVKEEAKAAAVRLALHSLTLRHETLKGLCKDLHTKIEAMQHLLNLKA